MVVKHNSTNSAIVVPKNISSLRSHNSSSNSSASDVLQLYEELRIVDKVSCSGEVPNLISLLNNLNCNRPFSKALFYKHLEKEHSSESLEFWDMAIKWYFDYNRNPDYKKHALYIIDQFIKQGSPRQVNISHASRAQVVSKIKGHIPQDIFNKALSDVYHLVRNDNYARFVKKMKTTNVTDREAHKRTLLGLFGIVMWFSMPLGLFYLSQSIWVGFVNILWSYWIFFGLFTGYSRV